MRCLEKASQMAADKRFEGRIARLHKWTVKEGKCLPDRETPAHAAKDRSKEMTSCSKSLGLGLGVGSGSLSWIQRQKKMGPTKDELLLIDSYWLCLLKLR